MSTAAEKYKNMKVKELQELLQKNGIPHTGKKEELIDRLVKHDEQAAQELANLEEEFGDLSEFDDTKLALDDEAKLGLDDITDPTKHVEEEEKETKEKKNEASPSVPPETITTTTTTTTAAKTPEPVVKPNSNFKFTPITFDKKSESPKPSTTVAVEEKKKEPTLPTAVKLPITPSTKINDDAEKALERAKRFGIQLNETAKKDIRAQRFGIPTDKKQSSPKTASKGSINPEVLKKRAERFGLPAKSSTTSTAAKPVKEGLVPVTLDPAEEEKKRKRAERFNSDASKKQKN